MKYLFFVTVLLLAVGSTAQESSNSNGTEPGIVRLNSEMSYLMLEPNEDLRKIDVFLNAKKEGQLQPRTLYIGANLIGIMDYQHSNTTSKFGYLMRHPTENNQVTNDVSEAVLHSASLSFSGAVNNWLSLYTEFLYNPEQSFGPGTTTSLGRNQVQLRKGFITIGDLNEFPMYFALGKMDGNFGLQGSVSPFTNTTMWHAFASLAYGAMIGYDNAGFNASLMLIQGGSQFRAANVPVNGTKVPSQLSNYSLDANYTLDIGDKGHLKLGASYQKGTTYCQSFPITHFSTCETHNPAFSYYGQLDHGALTIKAAFAKTTEIWEGTKNPNPPLDVFEASKVSSLIYGAQYRLNHTGAIRYTASAEFSNFIAGDKGAPWERQNQIVVGLSGQVEGNSKLFVEVFQTAGYVPLNFISGGNFDDLGVTHSDADATSIGIVIGGMITL